MKHLFKSAYYRIQSNLNTARGFGLFLSRNQKIVVQIEILHMDIKMDTGYTQIKSLSDILKVSRRRSAFQILEFLELKRQDLIGRSLGIEIGYESEALTEMNSESEDE